MLVNKQNLLQKLPPFTNIKKVVKVNQGVTDIIKGILQTHEEYKKDYDKISDYFLGNNCNHTAKNIWQFLKKNVPYYIESDNVQTLRSPSAVIALPGDCKSYSLFSMGILDSLRRKGKLNCDLSFRFAGYNSFTSHLEHVFAVINPGSKNEIWCDAVLNNFNQKKQPTIFKDKKIINNMALVGLSGFSTDRINGRPVSRPAPPPSHPAPPSVAHGSPTRSMHGGNDKGYKSGNIWMAGGIDDNMEGTQAIGTLTDVITSAANTASSLSNPVTSVASAVALVASLFPGHSNWWLMDDAYHKGDYQTAANFMVKFYTDPSFNTVPGRAGFSGDLAVPERQSWIPIIYNATKRQDILDIWKAAVKNNLLPSTGLPSTGLFSSSAAPGSSTTPQFMGMNMYVTLALAGAAAYMIYKMN